MHISTDAAIRRLTQRASHDRHRRSRRPVRRGAAARRHRQADSATPESVPRASRSRRHTTWRRREPRKAIWWQRAQVVFGRPVACVGMGVLNTARRHAPPRNAPVPRRLRRPQRGARRHAGPYKRETGSRPVDVPHVGNNLGNGNDGEVAQHHRPGPCCCNTPRSHRPSPHRPA